MGEATCCLIPLAHKAANQSWITYYSRTAVSARSLYSSEHPWGLKMSSSLNANEIKTTPGSDVLGKKDRKMETSTESIKLCSALRNKNPLKMTIKDSPGETGKGISSTNDKVYKEHDNEKWVKNGLKDASPSLPLTITDTCLACPVWWWKFSTALQKLFQDLTSRKIVSCLQLRLRSTETQCNFACCQVI